jgi:hypothetical protein
MNTARAEDAKLKDIGGIATMAPRQYNWHHTSHKAQRIEIATSYQIVLVFLPAGGPPP